MGKSSIVYVVGLSMLIAYGLLNISESSNSSMDTYTSYYGRTMGHNIALAGANIGTRLVLNNPAYSANLLNQDFAGGEYDMRITKIGDTAYVKSTSVIEVGGETIRDTIVAVLKHVSFSKYGYFSEKELVAYWQPDGTPYSGNGTNVWWITGDSVFGAAHTNGRFNLAGRPYFHDKVTATNSPNTQTYGGVYAPIFNAGYQWGVSVARNVASLNNLEDQAINGSATENMSYIQNNDAAMTFFPDGRVHVRIPPGTGAIRNDTLPISAITSTGVIGVRNGDIRVKGTYHGQLTLLARKGTSGTGTNKGNIWIDGNIVAANNPAGDPSSRDMLGLVSERILYVTKDNSRNASSVLNIQAAMYSHAGVFTAQDFWTIAPHGRINLLGSLAQINRGPVGTFSGGALNHGFMKSYRFDPRYLTMAPPFFPASNKYELASWWEN